MILITTLHFQVYIDETQDFTQAELFLLMCLTDKPNRMFMTGDTAQSIMCGVAFRFADLKTLLYCAKEKRISAKHAQLVVSHMLMILDIRCISNTDSSIRKYEYV